MYKSGFGLPEPTTLVCPECKGTMFSVNYNQIECKNCGWIQKRGNNKYGAKRTVANDGKARDSKYEASVADELLMRKRAGDILDYDSQYMVEIWIYREDGRKAFKVKHKVDFRAHNLDGSFELIEAKGVDTADWKWRRRLLEELWLPFHLDHTYRVTYQNK